MKAILSGYWLPRYLSPSTFVAKVIGLTTALAAGYTIGREGPLVHLSCTLATGLMTLPGFGAIAESHNLKRSMLGVACAVGVVATFGTPIGGVLFSIEVTSTYYMVSNLWRSFLGSFFSVAAFQLFAGLELISAVPNTRFAYTARQHVARDYVVFLGVGVLQGLLAALLVHLLTTVHKGLRSLSLLKPAPRRFATGLLICAVCTTLGIAFPPLGMTNHQALSGPLTREPPRHLLHETSLLRRSSPTSSRTRL